LFLEVSEFLHHPQESEDQKEQYEEEFDESEED
jgi:hypothetical protein